MTRPVIVQTRASAFRLSMALSYAEQRRRVLAALTPKERAIVLGHVALQPPRRPDIEAIKKNAEAMLLAVYGKGS